MQEVLDKDTLFLLQKVYGNKIDEVLDEDTFFNLLKDYFTLNKLDTKKELYEHLSKLSEVYLSSLNNKKIKNILKEIVPQIDEVASSFFEVSKYCSNEHIFDDFCIKNMTYDKLLVMFPKMLSNLKIKRKEEKKDYLLNLFNDCTNIKDCITKIQECIKNKNTYQEEIKEVYPNYQDFFNYFKISYKKIDINTKLDKYDYNTLYQFFLNQTILIKKEEIEKEEKEYQELLGNYQSIIQEIRILELQPDFKQIKEKDINLKLEENELSKKELNTKSKIRVIDKDIETTNKEKDTYLNKNIIVKIIKRKEINTLTEKINKLLKEKEELLNRQSELSNKKTKIRNKIKDNENYLVELCTFKITIPQFEKRLKEYQNDKIEELKENKSELEQQLLKYHIEKKEKELQAIYDKESVKNEKLCN